MRVASVTTDLTLAVHQNKRGARPRGLVGEGVQQGKNAGVGDDDP